jgi:hypothetical protein
MSPEDITHACEAPPFLKAASLATNNLLLAKIQCRISQPSSGGKCTSPQMRCKDDGRSLKASLNVV